MTSKRKIKSERITVRASASVKRLIQNAAQASDTNVSAFLLEAGTQAAKQALSEGRLFELEDARWEAFLEVLDRPVQSKARLRSLFEETGVLG